MTKKMNDLLEKVLVNITPDKKELEEIDSKLKEFVVRINKRIKKLKIEADLFVGGSFAKNTVVRKGIYDVDLFLRFSKKYKNEDLSRLARKILRREKGLKTVHGSRDYFRTKILKNVYFEIIPVRRIRSPKEAENITDLSYSHVKYLIKKIKSKKIFEEIKLAKVFCYATNTYGAESYIQGFSGYSLELLIYHYKSFLKFLRAVVKIKDKEIIDIEKHYKKKSNVLLDMNESKLQSPIVLIDPTFKQRNALAGLSEDTFRIFQEKAREFLKNPSIKNFELKKVDLEKIKKNALKKEQEFILLKIKTMKEKGDIAGTKLLKFYRHLIYEFGKYFDIKDKGFDYGNEKSARCFFVVKPHKEIILNGPFIIDRKNVSKFKEEHEDTFEKKNRIYARKKIDFSLKEFVVKWKKKNKRKVREMSVRRVKVI